VHDRKTVLFVAEKMAALDVVHARLRRVGLGSTCLELHSRAANKKQVLAELEETLNQNAVEPDSQAETKRLTDIRDTLNAVASRMHATIGDTGVTPFQALSRLVSGAERGIASFPPLLAEARNWSGGEYASVVEATARLVEITSSAGPSVHHPFFGVQATQLQPAELQRLSGPLTSLAAAAVALADWVEAIAQYLGTGQEISLKACETSFDAPDHSEHSRRCR
jgi:hypothetical protein